VVPMGRTIARGALRVDQHLFLEDRARTSLLDITALALALALERPLSAHPSGVVVGLRLRFVDVFGAGLATHFATSLEGGPTLAVRVFGRASLDLALLGEATDFIDLSPPDSVVSSSNRDRVAQRMVLGLGLAGEGVLARVEASFNREDAAGEAFDAVGGALSGRLALVPMQGVELRTGFAVNVRRRGPVGDAAVIGPAALRTETRLVAELGLRWSLAGPLALVLEDVWIRSDARPGHAYVENVASSAVEVTF
jgi:hypothetical protein